MKLSWRGALPLVGLLACVGDEPVGGDAGSDAGAPPTDAAVTPQDAATTPDTAAPPPDGSPTDDGGPTGRCDPTKEFGTPVLMTDLSTAGADIAFSMTRDELTAFVVRGTAAPVVMQATRSSSSSGFGPPTETNLANVNAGEGSRVSVSTSADGLTLYWQTNTVDGGNSIRIATRATTAAPFGTASQVTAGGSPLTFHISPHLSIGGDWFYWLGLDGMQQTSTANTLPGLFMAGRKVGADQEHPVVSRDSLTLYYTKGNNDVLRARRSTVNDIFPEGAAVGSVSSPAKDYPLYVTHDDCVMVLASDRPGGLGGFDLYMAKRPR